MTANVRAKSIYIGILIRSFEDLSPPAADMFVCIYLGTLCRYIVLNGQQSPEIWFLLFKKADVGFQKTTRHIDFFHSKS